MDIETLYECINNFPQTRVLCIGDIFLENLQPGGVDNVFKILSDLGVEVYLVAVVGQNEDASYLECQLKNFPGNPSEQDRIMLIRQDNTNTASFAHDGSDRNNTAELELETRLLKAVQEYLPNTDTVIFSDYGKGALTPKIVKYVISQASVQEIKILVEPHQSKSIEQYNGAHLMKMNQFNLSEISGNSPVESDEEVLDAARRLAVHVPDVELLLITRDQDGISLLEPSTDLHVWEPSHVISLSDPAGAGDAVLAVMALCMTIELRLRDAMFLASIAAAIVIAKPGLASVTRDEMHDFIKLHESGKPIFKTRSQEKKCGCCH